MRSTRTLLLAALLTSGLLVAGCGSSDSSSSSGSDGASASSTDSGTTDGGSTDGGSSAEVPSEDGALTFDAFMSGDYTEDIADETELITVVGVLGADASGGYIVGETVVAKAKDDTDSVQFLCIAADVGNFETYDIVVVRPDGTNAGC